MDRQKYNEEVLRVNTPVSQVRRTHTNPRERDRDFYPVDEGKR